MANLLDWLKKRTEDTLGGIGNAINQAIGGAGNQAQGFTNNIRNVVASQPRNIQQASQNVFRGINNQYNRTALAQTPDILADTLKNIQEITRPLNDMGKDMVAKQYGIDRNQLEQIIKQPLGDRAALAQTPRIAPQVARNIQSMGAKGYNAAYNNFFKDTNELLNSYKDLSNRTAAVSAQLAAPIYKPILNPQQIARYNKGVGNLYKKADSYQKVGLDPQGKIARGDMGEFAKTLAIKGVGAGLEIAPIVTGMPSGVKLSTKLARAGTLGALGNVGYSGVTGQYANKNPLQVAEQAAIDIGTGYGGELLGHGLGKLGRSGEQVAREIKALDTAERAGNKGFVGGFAKLPGKNNPIDPLEALKAEARKYKSAEEFVKAQGDPLLHGTTRKFDAFDISKAGTRNPNDQGFAGKGIYLTNSKQVAETFAAGKDVFTTKSRVEANRIVDSYLDKDARILDVKDFKELADKMGLPDSSPRTFQSNADNIATRAREQGYDAIRVDGGGKDKYGTKTFELAVLNPDKIKTKQQLTDLYNQANAPVGKYKTVHQGGKSVQVDGEPIKIADGLDTFIHKDENGNWVVSEATTGRSLTGGGYENKTFAIKAARDVVMTNGVDNVKKRVAEVAPQVGKNVNGEVPKYVKQPNLVGKLSPEDAIIQSGLDSGWGGLLKSGQTDITKLTPNERAYLTKSATSYMGAGDPVLIERANAYVKKTGETALTPPKPTAPQVGKTDYRSTHQIDTATAKNIGNLQNVDDIVTQVKSKYGLTNYDQKDIANLKKIIGNPEADVKIYRASPVNEINSGDWVTTSKTYANDIKRQNGGKVYEYTVKAKELNLPANIEDNPSLARFSAFQYSKADTPRVAQVGKTTQADHWTTPLPDNGPTPIPKKLDSNGVQIKAGDKIEFYGASPDGKKGTTTIRWQGPYKANASGKEFPGQWLGNGTLDNNIPFKIIERDGKPFSPPAQVGKTDPLSKFGWKSENTSQGTMLYNRNGKHVATITEKKGRYTAIHTDGTRIATGADPTKLADDVARKYFYATEVKPTQATEPVGGTLRPDKAPEPYTNPAIQSGLTAERARLVQENTNRTKAALDFDRQPTPKKAFHSTASLDIEGGKLRASQDGAMGEGVYLHTNPDTAKVGKTTQATLKQANELVEPPTGKTGGNLPPKTPPTKPGTPELPNVPKKSPKTTEVKLNTDRLDLSKTQKARVDKNTAATVKRMSNAEVEKLAKSAGIDTKQKGFNETRKEIAEQLNTRRKAVQLEKQADRARRSGDTEKAKALLKKAATLEKTSRTQGTAAGRNLQARKIIANELNSPQQKVFKLLDEAGVDVDKYVDRFADVDFSNSTEVAKAYRELVPATAEEWLDKYRYTNMLSSPLTHLVNISSNLTGTLGVSPIRKIYEGGVDATRNAVTRSGRTRYAGEGAVQFKESLKNIPAAVKEFKDVWTGKVDMTNPDFENTAITSRLAVGGKKGAIDSVLSFIPRLLEASDRFSMNMTEAGELGSLKYRQGKGIKVTDMASKAKENATYTAFRQELNKNGQGHILGAIDWVPTILKQGREAKNPIIRNASKIAFPFVNTLTNLFKQGIEYSPLGVTTLWGNSNKTAQSAKMLMGTTATALIGGTLAANDALTFAEPSNAKERDAFRAEGKQAYSFKIGDKWIGYSKMHPAIAFNFAITAAVKDAMDKGTIDQSASDKIMSAAGGMMGYFTDQSYMKNIGDLVSVFQSKDGSSIGDSISSEGMNTINQLVPFRSMVSWIGRQIDPTQRKVDYSANVMEQIYQGIVKDIPGLNSGVPTRKNPYTGQDIKSDFPLLNSWNPYRVTQDMGYGNTTGMNVEQRQMQKGLPETERAGFRAGVMQQKGLERLADKEKEQLKSAEGQTKTLSNGKVYAKVGDKYETFDSQEKADVAIFKDEFKKSDKKSAVKGDTYFYKKKNGDVVTKPKALYDWEQTDARANLEMDRAYEAKDIDTWAKAAQTKLDGLEKKKSLYDPETEQDEIDKITLQQENLLQKAAKYLSKGMGGSGGSGSRGGSRGGSGGSGGSGSFITTGFKTAAQLKAPKIKGISVRKPTYKASTKKLSVSKMPKVTGVRLT